MTAEPFSDFTVIGRAVSEVHRTTRRRDQNALIPVTRWIGHTIDYISDNVKCTHGDSGLPGA